jgi:hypothetical protein
MTNFDFHPTSNFVFFAVMDLKSKHSLLYQPFYKYPLSLQLVLEPTISCSLLHTFLQLWQYMLIILTWEFFINFSFSIVLSYFTKKTNFMFGIDSKDL